MLHDPVLKYCHLCLHHTRPSEINPFFFKQLHGVIKQIGITRNESVIVGGDWNTILDAKIDKAGGVIKTGDTKTLEMKSLIMDLDLIDIWRLKNPTVKRFTFRQRQPLIQSRLDYFLISTCINDMVDKTKILTSFCSDHSCIEFKTVSFATPK